MKRDLLSDADTQALFALSSDILRFIDFRENFHMPAESPQADGRVSSTKLRPRCHPA